MIVRKARYLLTQLLFLTMGLPIRRYRNQVKSLWSLSEEARIQKLDELLACNRPINSAGLEVTGMEALRASPSLSKKLLRNKPIEGQQGRNRLRFVRHTAGTTGEPVQISLSREELARMLGVRDYCIRHYGVKLGQREGRLWGRPESGAKSRFKNFLMNRRVFHPVGPNARKEVSDLLKWRPDYLYGYASLLLEAAKLLEKMDLDFEPPKCVVCTAESVLPAQKAYIARVFRAPVAEEYGSTEFDVIAFECKGGHRHLVNPWLIVENSDDACLVTDVVRRTQGLIKYELGDSLSTYRSSCRKLGSNEVVDCLEGRTLDRFFYINAQEKVHASVFPSLFDRYFAECNEIFGFTVVQVGFSKVKVFIDECEKIDKDDLQAFLERELFNYLKITVDVEVSLSETNKRVEKRNYFVQKIPGFL